MSRGVRETHTVLILEVSLQKKKKKFCTGINLYLGRTLEECDSSSSVGRMQTAFLLSSVTEFSLLVVT